MTWRPALGATVAGLAASIAFPPFGCVPIAFVAWAPLFLALEGATLVEGLALGFTAGTVFFAVLLLWLSALSVPLWIAVSLYLALYVAAFGAIATRLWSGPRAARLALPAAWVALESMRGWLFGGVPGAELGMALAPIPWLLPLASAGGVAVLSLAIVACNQAVAAAANAVQRGAPFEATRAVSLAITIPLALTLPALRVMPASGHPSRVSAGIPAGAGLDVGPGEPGLDVAIVERGLDIAMIGGDTDPRVAATGDAFGRAILDYVAKTDRACEAGPVDLVIWPETALPRPLEVDGLAIHARALRQRIEQRWQASLLLGVPVAADTNGFWNEAQLWSPVGVARYQKRRLVPFGEYAPELPLVGKLPRVLSGPELVPGADGDPVVPFLVAGVKLGVLICFEDLFSADVLERAAASDALVVVTNDVWLGETGAAQHLSVAVLRAVETGRWVARVANRGASVVIDPSGRPTPATLAPQRLPATDGRTLFAAAPDLVPWIALGVTIAALAARRIVRPSRG